MQKMKYTNDISPGCSGLIGITMGCPVGVGPEIILRFLSKKEAFGKFLPIVIGDIALLRRCAKELQVDIEIVLWQPGNPVDVEKLQVIEPGGSNGYSLDAESLHWGKPNKETGHAAAAYIIKRSPIN